MCVSAESGVMLESALETNSFYCCFCCSDYGDDVITSAGVEVVMMSSSPLQVCRCGDDDIITSAGDGADWWTDSVTVGQ